ncbi:MAG: TRAP transporter small permease [Desulfovibrionaceae bacterium]|nr:TRAP transporter small permease [Desulfovibrionaceae bacterium]
MVLTAVNDKIIKGLNVAIVGAMALLTLCIALQILNRFIFKIPMTWTEEFARYFFVWLGMLGSAKAFREHSHIFVDIIEVAVKGRISKICALLADLFCMVFFITLLRVSLPWAVNNFDTGTESIPEWGLGYFYLCIPIAAMLMILFGIENLALRAKALAAEGGE